MLIGIVSKGEHVKIHTQALRKDGFSVVGLGSSPTQIPPTVDLVILRTQSCSHGGSATAFLWNRATKRPLIVENGLTGIRSKLRFFAQNTTTPQVEYEPMFASNIVKIAPVDLTPAPTVLQYKHTFPEGCVDFQNLPTARLKRSFEEALPILEEIPEDLRAEIRSLYKRALQNNNGPFFPNISWYYGSKDSLVLGKLLSRPIHFFLVLQWLLLGFVDSAPTIKLLKDAYRDFCGVGCVKTYAEAAIWIVENGSKPLGTALGLADVATSPEDVSEGPGQGLDEYNFVAREIREETLSTEPPREVSSLRRDLEDFILEIAGTNEEVLKGVQAIREQLAQLLPLRGEVKALQNEVISLREELFMVSRTLSLRAERGSVPEAQKPVDAIQVLEGLRDRGAVINISFGPK